MLWHVYVFHLEVLGDVHGIGAADLRDVGEPLGKGFERAFLQSRPCKDKLPLLIVLQKSLLRRLRDKAGRRARTRPELA